MAASDAVTEKPDSRLTDAASLVSSDLGHEVEFTVDTGETIRGTLMGYQHVLWIRPHHRKADPDWHTHYDLGDLVRVNVQLLELSSDPYSLAPEQPVIIGAVLRCQDRAVGDTWGPVPYGAA